MTPASKKAKGRKFQQKMRDKIIELLSPFGVVAEDVKSTSMGASGEDIQLSPFASNLMSISPECKANKSFAVYKIYEQAQSNCNKKEPVVFIQGDRKKPLAIVDADHYIGLWRHKIESEQND